MNLNLGGQEIARAEDYIALFLVQCKEFEAMVEPAAVAHDSPDFNRLNGYRQRDLQTDHLAGLELTGESATDSVLAKFSRSTPKRRRDPIAKDLQPQTDID